MDQTLLPLPARHSAPAAEAAYHYGVIARAIAAIDAAGGEPLPLADLAEALHMSPAHFQRIFSQWAGVSPKRYQQYLTLGHAKALLADRASLAATAAATGLSGPSRLHDLFQTWEAMSPGDYARRGAGLDIAMAEIETPFGPALAMATPRGLCALAFTADCGRAAADADLRARWPEARFHEDAARVLPLVEAAFAGRGTHLHLIGAPFQIKVWEALLAIPPGAVTTYSAIAETVCSKAASRAVGSAVGRNPVGFLIPCHRVLRRDGGLGGYHWGLPVKRAMLAWESARAEAGA